MNKSIFKSKTVWGILIEIASFAASKIFHSNVALAGADNQALDIIAAIGQLGGSAMAIWGRCVADIAANKQAGKPWWKSQTIMSVVFSALIVIAGLFHIDVSQYVTSLFGITPDAKTSELGTGLLKELPLLYAIIGRVK